MDGSNGGVLGGVMNSDGRNGGVVNLGSMNGNSGGHGHGDGNAGVFTGDVNRMDAYWAKS